VHASSYSADFSFVMRNPRFLADSKSARFNTFRLRTSLEPFAEKAGAVGSRGNRAKNPSKSLKPPLAQKSLLRGHGKRTMQQSGSESEIPNCCCP
jgi:hypothetical protein